MRIMITGGAGFIGSAVARQCIQNYSHEVLVFDKLTYSGNLESLSSVAKVPRYHFVRGDICSKSAVSSAFANFCPDIVMHLAAESHVDRSIDNPGVCIETNIVGTFVMLDAALEYWRALDPTSANNFRFIHISTDEVFGSLGETGVFREDTPYAPNSPYSASKAASDHLARAWHKTYGLPTIVVNSSNNYGPYQFPEKLIPLIIINAIEEKSLPVYGSGRQIRDWLYVDDFARALLLIARNGEIGGSYNVGGRNEKENIEVVRAICGLLDELLPRKGGLYSDLIAYTDDRPGHDYRYATDCGKMERELDWQQCESFDSGLRKTLQWYVENRYWWQSIRTDVYCGVRIGLLNNFINKTPPC